MYPEFFIGAHQMALDCARREMKSFPNLAAGQSLGRETYHVAFALCEGDWLTDYGGGRGPGPFTLREEQPCSSRGACCAPGEAAALIRGGRLRGGLGGSEVRTRFLERRGDRIELMTVMGGRRPSMCDKRGSPSVLAVACDLRKTRNHAGSPPETDGIV